MDLDKLNQPLDAGLVQDRPVGSGRRAKYLSGHVVIDQANKVFGFGGWNYRLVAGPEPVHGIRPLRKDKKTGEVIEEGGPGVVGYRATVIVMVSVFSDDPAPGDVCRTDVGFAALIGQGPDDHDLAMKSAVTDAMKRAFRTFGSQFGNDLYASKQSGEPQKSHTQTRPPASTKDAKGNDFANEPIVCKECDQWINAYRQGATYMSSKEVAERTGGLCADCGAKAKQSA